MKARLLMPANRLPTWIDQGVQEYQKRLSPYCQFEYQLLSPAKQRTSKTTILQQEEQQFLKALPKNHWVVTLEVNGQPWSNDQLAQQVQEWQALSQNVFFLVGGAEGLGEQCVALAKSRWSLSPLVLPHAFIPLLVSEQLYRSFCILNHHPYHRG